MTPGGVVADGGSTARLTCATACNHGAFLPTAVILGLVPRTHGGAGWMPQQGLAAATQSDLTTNAAARWLLGTRPEDDTFGWVCRHWFSRTMTIAPAHKWLLGYAGMGHSLDPQHLGPLTQPTDLALRNHL